MFTANNSIKMAVGKALGAAYVPSTTIAALDDGEISFLKDDGTIMAAGATFANTKSIKLIQKRNSSLGQTYLFGAVMNGLFITSYKKSTYVAPAEQVSTVTVVANTATTYDSTKTNQIIKLRINFKGDKTFYSERTEAKVFEYVLQSGDTPTTIATALTALIVADKSTAAQVTATSAGAVITLTGLPKQFTLGYFKYGKCYFDVVSDFSATIALVTAVNKGNGTYEEVAELEWFVSGEDGASNKQIYPVATGRADATVGKTYDICAIEYYGATDRSKPVSGSKPSRALLYIAFEKNADATTLQSTKIYAILDPYMASLPNLPA
jgi:hypothetical protein